MKFIVTRSEISQWTVEANNYQEAQDLVVGDGIPTVEPDTMGTVWQVGMDVGAMLDEIAEVLPELDGTEQTAVSRMTGLSPEELDNLGGFGDKK